MAFSSAPRARRFTTTSKTTREATEPASAMLARAGVPGIRYLDQGSRQAGGTHNYVVFDPSIIDITHKNGQPVTPQQAHDMAMDFDPSEPRDEKGEWIDAYHGTPHDVQRFELSKVGTGEGNQALGYGLYFSENPDVAGHYSKALGGRHNLYGVRIHANAKQFLDMDEPLASQGEFVRDAVASVAKEVGMSSADFRYYAKKSGQEVYRQIGKHLFEAATPERKQNLPGWDFQAASAILAKAGVKGTKVSGWVFGRQLGAARLRRLRPLDPRDHAQERAAGHASTGARHGDGFRSRASRASRRARRGLASGRTAVQARAAQGLERSPMLVSTRNITAKKATENSAESYTRPDLEALHRFPQQEKAVAKLFANGKNYPGLRAGETGIRAAVDRMKDNLWALDNDRRQPIESSGRLVRGRAQGGRAGGAQVRARHGVGRRRLRGAEPTSAVGPKRLSRRPVDRHRQDEARREVGRRHDQVGRRLGDGALGRGQDRGHEGQLRGAEGYCGQVHRQSYDDLDDVAEKAIWVRAYDEAHSDRSYRNVGIDGDLGETMKNNDGTPSKAAWQNHGHDRERDHCSWIERRPGEDLGGAGRQAQGTELLQQHPGPGVRQQRRDDRHACGRGGVAEGPGRLFERPWRRTLAPTPRERPAPPRRPSKPPQARRLRHQGRLSGIRPGVPRAGGGAETEAAPVAIDRLGAEDQALRWPSARRASTGSILRRPLASMRR